MTRHLRLLGGHAIVLASLAVCCLASAQDPAQTTRATVTLTSGARHEGRLVEASPGKSIVLELPDGSVRSFQWRDVDSLVVDGPATVTPTRVASGPTPPAAPPVSNQSPGRSEASDCAGEGCQKGKGRRESVDVGRRGARYESEADCSEGDESCTERTKANLGKGGLGLSYSRESVGRVKRPPSGAFNFTLSASYYGAFGENLMMNGAGFSGSGRGMVGSRFPGPRGGHWFGFFLEPTAAFNFAAITITIPSVCVSGYCTQEQQQSSSATVAIGQLGAGLQWMRFGRMDTRTLKQSGFGLALGGTVGYQSTTSQGSTSGAVSYGPQISVLLPSYNAGTAKYRATNFNLFILPTKDMVMFMAGVQFVL